MASPFYIRAARAGFRAVEPEVEEAVRVDGATEAVANGRDEAAAALLLERGVSPADVERLIAGTAPPGPALGAGVVDVAGSLTAPVP